MHILQETLKFASHYRNLKSVAHAFIAIGSSSASSRPSTSQSSTRTTQSFQNSEPKLASTSVSTDINMEGVTGRSTLEVKVCVRTYRLFFVSKTEDWLWRDCGHESRLKSNKGGDRDDRNGKDGKAAKDNRAGANEGEMGFVRAVRARRRRRDVDPQLFERLREGTKVDGAASPNVEDSAGSGVSTKIEGA